MSQKLLAVALSLFGLVLTVAGMVQGSGTYLILGAVCFCWSNTVDTNRLLEENKEKLK